MRNLPILILITLVSLVAEASDSTRIVTFLTSTKLCEADEEGLSGLPITGPTIDARILNIFALQFLADGNLVLKAGTFNVSTNVITYDEGEESSLKAKWNLSNNSLNITTEGENTQFKVGNLRSGQGGQYLEIVEDHNIVGRLRSCPN